MSDKERLKDNYQLLINNLERKLDKLSSDRKLYNKLKKLLGVISIIVLIFGLWPVTLISIFLASVCAYQEKDKYKEYCNLIDKLEYNNEELSEVEEEIEREKNKGRKELEQVKESNLTCSRGLNLEGVNYDNEVCRKGR